jgi:hypothetical protein
VTVAGVARLRSGGGDGQGGQGEQESGVFHATYLGVRFPMVNELIILDYNIIMGCDPGQGLKTRAMSLKTPRRGIWVPKACFWPIVILGLIVIVADSCTRR